MTITRSAGSLVGVRRSRCWARRYSPLAGATLDVWQCDPLGVYSGVTDAVIGFDTVGLKFLTRLPGHRCQRRSAFCHHRARLVPGSDGAHPLQNPHRCSNWRYLRVHVALFLDDALIEQILAQSPYSAKGGQRDTTNATDMHFANGGDQLLLAPTEAAQGLAATFAIGLTCRTRPRADRTASVWAAVAPGGTGGPGEAAGHHRKASCRQAPASARAHVPCQCRCPSSRSASTACERIATFRRGA